MSILNYMATCSTDKPYAPMFTTQPKSERSNAIAIALVDAGELALEDVTNAKIKDGTTAASDVIGIVRALQLEGKAIYLPKGNILGSKPMGENLVQTTKYGNAAVAKQTGEVKTTFEFTYEHYFEAQSVEWFNWLRQNLEDYDVVVWTENKVTVIEDQDIAWNVMGYDLTGNSEDTVNGKFGFTYLSVGDPVFYPGVVSKDLTGYTALTIADPTPNTTKLVKQACSSDCTVFTAVAAAPLTTTLAFTVATVSNCLTWDLRPDCSNSSVLVGDTAQINPITGVVTVTAQAANTKKRYRVIAMTNSGIVGEYCMEIVTKA